jgi:mRNA interferase RelE/StbE
LSEPIWKVFVPERVEKELRRLPPKERERIEKAMEKLTKTPFPHGVEKMAGEPERWRIRVGKYRIVYRLEEAQRTIVIVTVGHRREVYRKG